MRVHFIVRAPSERELVARLARRTMQDQTRPDSRQSCLGGFGIVPLRCLLSLLSLLDIQLSGNRREARIQFGVN